MDKPLSDPQKKDGIQLQETHNVTPPATAFARPLDSTASFGAYAPKNQYFDHVHDDSLLHHLTTHAWEKSKNTAWASTPQGRLFIRGFSRGVLGAAFFTAGGYLAQKWMNGYSVADKQEYIKPYDAANSFSEQANPLQFVAKTIDTFVGKPIQWTVGALAGQEAGLAAVRFRPTKYIGVLEGNNVYGRSLGNEVIQVTFDFFCASLGDAMGRDIANLIDPGAKKPWYDKDGNLSLTETIKNTGKAAFRYLTYNGGEDWAVAIPYVYFMKAQRGIIDHFSPGFKYDFDRGLNGGSFKINDDLKVTGSFGLEGAIDLQTRFTFYNVGTLMYREAYNHVANLIQGKQSSLYGAPDAPDRKDRSLVEKAGDLGKWALRSTIKGLIYMTPSVPFFWMTRTAQSKNMGLFINPEQGLLQHISKSKGGPSSLRAFELKMPTGGQQHDYVQQKDDLFFSRFENDRWQPTTPSEMFKNKYNDDFQPFGQGGNALDRTLDKIGNAHQTMTSKNADWGRDIDDLITDYHLDPAKKFLGIGRTSEFLNKAMYAAVSYTPYMAAKAEFANMWDDGKMDLAAERMIDGATSFNWGEFKAGAGEVYRAILKRPLSDPSRETEAQRRIDLDSSAPVSFVQTQAERKAEKDKNKQQQQSSNLSWEERMFAGKKPAPDEKRDFDSRPRSFVENEAMKKALEETQPPTNAIH